MKSWKQKAKRRLQQLEVAEGRASRLESQLRLAHESEKVQLERAGRAEGELEAATATLSAIIEQRNAATDSLVALADELAAIGTSALEHARAARPEAPANPGAFLTWEDYKRMTECGDAEVPAWAGEPLPAPPNQGPGPAEGTISSALEVVTVRMMRGFAANAEQAIRPDPDAGPIAQNVVASLRDLLSAAAAEGHAERIPPEVLARLSPHPQSPEPYRLLVRAAREVDALLSADGPPFRFDSYIVTGDAQEALLSLHDRLNDVTRIFFPSWEQHPERDDR